MVSVKRKEGNKTVTRVILLVDLYKKVTEVWRSEASVNGKKKRESAFCTFDREYVSEIIEAKSTRTFVRTRKKKNIETLYVE